MISVDEPRIDSRNFCARRHMNDCAPFALAMFHNDRVIAGRQRRRKDVCDGRGKEAKQRNNNRDR